MQTIVYMATNRVNGKRYVGYTSKTLLRRRRQHEFSALSLRGECRAFHAAIRKYGAEAFDWHVLSEHLSREDGIQAEICQIAELRPAYNISKGGQGTNGVPWTEERRILFSRLMKGRVMSPEARVKWKKTYNENGYINRILCLDDGRVFKNAVEAAKHYGCDSASINQCCAGRAISAAGYMFVKYTNDVDHASRMEMIQSAKEASRLKRSLSKIGHLVSEETRRKIGAANVGSKRRVGKFHSQETKNGLREHGLKNVDRFKQFSHLGPKAVSRKVICVDDGSVHESASAAALAYKVAKSALIELCLGRRGRKTVGGLRFKYEEVA